MATENYRGFRIAELSVESPDDNPRAAWDGKDDSGKNVPPGAYIYQAKTDDYKRNGIITVAR